MSCDCKKTEPVADLSIKESDRKSRVLTLYRDDSTSQVVYEDVKTYFFTSNNTVLTISKYKSSYGNDHYYIHWPRERFCWFKDVPSN